MKRTIILATAAAAMLTGCVKTEVNPVAVPEQEISYQAVVGPKTKAEHSPFGDGNVFVSYAYLLGKDQTWENDKNDAELYIDGKTVSCENGTWKAWGSNYYWPNEGSVTFFAWSNHKKKTDEYATTLKSGTVGCSPEKGITVTDYDASQNVNFDFMVAMRQENQKANTSSQYYTDGVPTLFKHRLCQVKYSVKTDHEYKFTHFYIKSLKFTNIHQCGNFAQEEPIDKWTFTESQTAIEYKYDSSDQYSGDNNNKLSKTPYPAANYWDSATADQHYFIPQTFTDESVIVIDYVIESTVGNTKEEKTQQLNLNHSDLFGPTGWVANKIYTINITLGLDEILWDPAVEEWETGDVGVAGDDPDWSIVESQSN